MYLGANEPQTRSARIDAGEADVTATGGEVLIVLAALVAGLVPLGVWLWRPQPARARLVLAAGLVLCAVAAAPLASAYLRSVQLAAGVSDRPLEVRSDGYTSSKACQACHPDQYASWYGSYHRQMTQVASPESVKAPFDGRVLEAESRYRVMRQGDEFWVVTGDPTWAPPTGGPAARRVVLVSGSHHQQLYWFETGRDRSIARLPFFYRVPEQRWVRIHSAFLAQSTTESTDPGQWNRVCIRCHATHSVPRWGDFVNMDTEVAEFGIACESCHGPGEEHVRRNRNPVTRYASHFSDGRDETIANPEHLDAERSIQVCGRCHSVHAFESFDAAAAWSEGGLPFRPGDDLRDTFHLFEYGGDDDPGAKLQLSLDPHFFEDRFWSDGMVSVLGREYNGVRDSPCFASGEFDCTTCHAMHREPDDARTMTAWADDQLAPGMRGDAACVQCHEDLGGAALEAHTRHPAASAGSRCQNCHMPNTGWGLLKASRSHLVDSPDTAATLATGRPNACNLCHLDQPLRWTARHLESWYGIESPPMPDPDHHRIAEGALHALRGHAGQRALMAWHLGWEPAREASGTEWMVPLLAELMLDPYDAVRQVAQRSLQTLPGWENRGFDPFDPPERRSAGRDALLTHWRAGPRELAGDPQRLLLDGAGDVDATAFARLLEGRDHRRVFRAE